MPNKKRITASLFFSLEELNFNSVYPITKLSMAQSTLVSGVDKPMPGESAKGVGMPVN
jgi:hypothetical protein